MRKRINIPKLMRAVDKKRKKSALTWLEVTNELGYKSSSTVHNMSRGANVRSDHLISALLWLGTTDFGPYLMEVDDEEV